MAAQCLPAGAAGHPALQKLAGLYQEAQLILTSARTSDPPEGILTLRLFSSELLPGAFGFITGNSTDNNQAGGLCTQLSSAIGYLESSSQKGTSLTPLSSFIPTEIP